jgi:methylated-DNA-protein-cysteine methyltransferase related protein
MARFNDTTIARKIRELLARRAVTSSICPSDVARALRPHGDWRALMEDIRTVAGKLVAAGEVAITQRGRPVELATVRGPIRISAIVAPVARSSDRTHLLQLFTAMHAVIRAIPRGTVTTYGRVAELAGFPGGARVAAASLKRGNSRGHDLPWQRVIGKASGTRGRIAILDPVGAAIQRKLLEEEGVIVGDSGLVKLDVFGWLPKTTKRPSARALETKPKRATGGSVRAASPRRQPRSGSKHRA